MTPNYALVQYSFDRYIESLPLEKQALMGGMDPRLLGALVGGGLGLGTAALSGNKKKPWLRNLLIGAGLGGLGGYGYDKFQDYNASFQDGGSRFTGPPRSAMNKEPAESKAKVPGWNAQGEDALKPDTKVTGGEDWRTKSVANENDRKPAASEKKLPPSYDDGASKEDFGHTRWDKTPEGNRLAISDLNQKIEQAQKLLQNPYLASEDREATKNLISQAKAQLGISGRPGALAQIEGYVGDVDQSIRNIPGAIGKGVDNTWNAVTSAPEKADAARKAEQDRQALHAAMGLAPGLQ